MFRPRAAYAGLLLALLWNLSTAAEPEAAPPTAARAAEQRIREAMAKPLPCTCADGKPFECVFRDDPLEYLLPEFERALGLPIVVDQQAVDRDTLSRTVTLNLDNVALGTAFELALEQCGLDWTIRHEMLQVSTREAVREHIYSRTYPVADLTGGSLEAVQTALCDPEELLQLVTNTVAPASWAEVGGAGSIEQIGWRGLVVAQSRPVHDELAALLAEVRATLLPANPSAKDDAIGFDARWRRCRQVSQRLDHALSRPLPRETANDRTLYWDLKQLPLKSALKRFEQWLEVAIVVDRGEVDIEALQVTHKLAGISTDAALDAVLQSCDLSWTLYGEVILVSSPERVENYVYPRIYLVGDLLADDADAPIDPLCDPDTLIEVISNTVAPETWTEVGGKGDLCPIGYKAFFIRQSRPAHEAIAELLADLRHTLLAPALAEAAKANTGAKSSRPSARAAEFGPATQALADGNNTLAVRLFREWGREPDHNIVAGPISISLALSMLTTGARDETYEELASALDWNRPAEELSDAVAALRGALLPGNPIRGRSLPTLTMAQGLWYPNDLQIEEPFLTAMREQFGSAIEHFLPGPIEKTRMRINQWVSTETRGKIPECLLPGSLDASAVMVLASAMYLDANWEHPFEPALTRPDTFHAPGGDCEVPMMQHAMLRLPYGEFDGTQVVELPYVGRELSMYVVLPPAEHLRVEWERTLTADMLDEWSRSLRLRRLQLEIPKFRIDDAPDLKSALPAIGVNLAFDADQADFSGIADKESFPLYVSQALHKAHIDVNEKGTEAAAVAGIAGSFGSAISRPEFLRFHADRPFLFYIRHRSTGAVLFLGRVVDPRAS